MQVYILLKRRIEKKTYRSKEEMKEMLDTYYFVGRITTEQYKELTEMLKEA